MWCSATHALVPSTCRSQRLRCIHHSPLIIISSHPSLHRHVVSCVTRLSAFGAKTYKWTEIHPPAFILEYPTFVAYHLHAGETGNSCIVVQTPDSTDSFYLFCMAFLSKFGYEYLTSTLQTPNVAFVNYTRLRDSVVGRKCRNYSS